MLPETDGWPDPEPAQTAVLLLGCYHMDNPGLDAVNPNADDVLATDRQRELESLADRLADWRPAAVAVERPAAEAEAVNALYGEYAAGDRRYDAVEGAESTQPNGPAVRSEVVQVAFRVADRLGHEQVHPVDYPMTMGAKLDESEAESLDQEAMLERALSTFDVELPDPETVARRAEDHLAESTVTEHLAWLNDEQRLRENHDLLFAQALAGSEQRYIGARMAGAWYERNIRVVENLWHATGGTPDRVLLLFGSGHVRVLRHLLTEAPPFCPVSPLPVLEPD